MKDRVIVKYGEIGLKGLNRPSFESQLIRNLRWMLRDFPGTIVRREQGRIFVEGGDTAAILGRVARTFGVVGASAAKAARLELSDIVTAGQGVLQEALSQGKRTFKVETRRPNKNFPLKSPEVSRDMGAELLRAFPESSVDVHNPDIVIQVEVRDQAAYVYGDSVSGPGGLPVGSSSRGLLLLSGGIDSPVAGWLAMRRGVRLAAIHFHSYPYTSERAKRKVLDLAEILAAYGGTVDVHLVHFTDVQTTLRDKAPADLIVTLMRRMMLRIAERIAAKEGIPALITGESVGQVASQTLESMAAINAVTNMPILRPLVAADKSGIISLARSIGTYETSIQPYEDCCTLFLPEHPQTRPRLQEVEKAEEALNIAEMLEACLEQTEIFSAEPHPAATLYEGGSLNWL